MNVRASLQLIARRTAAYLVDIVLLFVVLAPLGIGVQALLGYQPQTPFAVWLVIAVNFSIPVWLYFTLFEASSRRGTPGKWLLKLQVNGPNGQLSWQRALARTAVKLLPWELVHLSGFAIAVDFETLSAIQTGGLLLANILVLVYYGLVILNDGKKSLHDLITKTQVNLISEPPK